MFNRNRTQPTPTPDSSRSLIAKVDSESRPYTDPKADYDFAQQARAQRQGRQGRS